MKWVYIALLLLLLLVLVFFSIKTINGGGLSALSSEGLDPSKMDGTIGNFLGLQNPNLNVNPTLDNPAGACFNVLGQQTHC